MNAFTVLRQHLGDPEYLHVLLNPLPVYGLAIATLALVLALFLRNQRVTVAALVLVFVCALSAWPTYHYGEAGYDRVKAMSDPAGEQWLDEHMARGEKLIWVFYVLAGLAAVGILAPLKWPRSVIPLAGTTLALGALTLGIGGWIAYAGGHVRHKEFRFEPPPVAKTEGHHHGEESAKDQGSMEGMQHEVKSEPAQPMEHGATQQPAASSTQEQLEASRLQLEASRLQLEASRKQLEAADPAKKQASPSPQQGKPTPSPSDHQHEHP